MNYKNDVISKMYKGIYKCTKRDMSVKYPNVLNKNKNKSNTKVKSPESKI